MLFSFQGSSGGAGSRRCPETKTASLGRPGRPPCRADAVGVSTYAGGSVTERMIVVKQRREKASSEARTRNGSAGNPAVKAQNARARSDAFPL
jgi:hypothetical protein